jgi:hypothetical protein
MPEEINRIVADHASDYLFAPTRTAEGILKGEGLGDRTYLTGDIMVDTITENLPVALKSYTSPEGIDLEKLEYNLLTLHRNYNVDNPGILEGILRKLEDLGEVIIFPVHPRTMKMLEGIDFNGRNIVFTEPIGYLDFVAYEHFSKRIITDSGGVQKEAYILRKPCITLRTETEWTETVREGWNLLLDPSDEAMCEKIMAFRVPQSQNQVFGEKVTERMVEIINGWTYGRFEVRAKVPTGTGTWPAIWMLGTNIREVGWPACGEIDIMENVGFDPHRVHGYVHTAAYNHTRGTQKGNSLELDKPWENFHVYAIEWFEDRIDFFIDDENYFTFEKESDDDDVWPFDKPHYLLLNLAIGGNWGGQQGIDDSLFPHRFIVDYVRVYQQR